MYVCVCRVSSSAFFAREREREGQQTVYIGIYERIHIHTPIHAAVEARKRRERVHIYMRVYIRAHAYITRTAVRAAE